MIEQVYKITFGDEKIVEKVIQDENMHYLHMVFNKTEGLPEHYSNSTVYMTVVRGTLSIGLNEQNVNKHEAGTILKIPFNTKMNVKNLNDEVLELLVVKAPAPQAWYHGVYSISTHSFVRLFWMKLLRMRFENFMKMWYIILQYYQRN